MAVYFQMAELSDVPVYSTLTVASSTTAGTFNSSNARASIFVPEGTDLTSYIESPSFSATNLWVHFVQTDTTVNVISPEAIDKSLMRIMAGGTQRLRVNIVDVNTINLSRWTGAAWAVLDTYVSAGQFDSTRNTFDVHAPVGAAETISVYLNNTLVLSATEVDTTFSGTVSAFDKVIWGCPNFSSTSFGVFFSELIGADWNTIGSKLVTRIPDANGNYSEWTNDDYTVVDEVAGGIDYASSGVADQRTDWSMSAFPALGANEQIVSVQINAMINRDTGGPQNANFFIRQGSTDYHDTNQSLSTSQSLMKTVYTTDPSTSSNWTVTNLNSATYGIRSRT